MHDRHLVGDAERDVEVVLDDDVADMRGERGEDRDQVAPLVGRQPGGRLVEQNEARRPGEGERNLELALLAVAELGHQPIGAPV